MDRRITLAFVAILILLGGYIWYAFLRADAPPQTPVTPAPTPISFLQLKTDQVNAIQVRDVKTNQTTRVVRDGDKWKMEQPAQGEAFFSRVGSFVALFNRVNADRKIETPGDLAAFGLNPPQYELRLEMQDGSALTIQLGDQNPDGNYFYARKNDDAAVYLINSSLGEKIKEFVTLPPYIPTPTAPPAPSETPESTPTP